MSFSMIYYTDSDFRSEIIGIIDDVVYSDLSPQLQVIASMYDMSVEKGGALEHPSSVLFAAHQAARQVDTAMIPASLTAGIVVVVYAGGLDEEHIVAVLDTAYIQDIYDAGFVAWSQDNRLFFKLITDDNDSAQVREFIAEETFLEEELP